MYKCLCGKTFDNVYAFNGHKTHCKQHQVITYGEEHYQKNYKQQVDASKAAIVAIKNKYQNKINQWISEKHTCEKCGKVMLTKFGSGRFCCRACANSRTHSEETKNKIKRSLDKKVRHRTKPLKTYYCFVCGKQLKHKTKTGLCQNCLNHSAQGLEIRKQKGKETFQKTKEAGKFKGWQSRNIKSYAEKFFETVLQNNNISYKREVSVKHNNSNYFLDFVIEKNNILIDLEIDGKQHKYEDRLKSDKIRDEFLINQHYIVYRIDWNEISKSEGKQLMEKKINKFISFYNKL